MAEFLSVFSSFPSCNAPGPLLTAAVLFSQTKLADVEVACLGQLSVYAHYPSANARSLRCQWGAHKELATEQGCQGRYMEHRVPVGQLGWGGTTGEVLPAAHGQNA